MSTQLINNEKPLVTFALFAYNQEQYIRGAVEAALAQNYSPLQIIFSDDCSSDSTFEIIEGLVKHYSGPHQLVLNRNPVNLGIGSHINKLNQLATGEFVVVAAGDDISLPHRVLRIVQEWVGAAKRPGMIHSSCRVINEDGVETGQLDCPCLDVLNSATGVARSNAFVIGATEAWDPKLFDQFGDLRDDLTHEDRALPFRALLARREIKYIDEPLVYYRQGIGISAHYKGSGQTHLHPDQRRRILQRLLIDALQKNDDLKFAGSADPALLDIVRNSAKKYEISLEFERRHPKPKELIEMASGSGWRHVIRMSLKLVANRWRDKRCGYCGS